jgi:mono/diheme cytochrome c family protein
MRTVIKILGVLLGGLAVLAAIALAVVIVVSNHKLSRKYVVSVEPLEVHPTPAAIASGRHIAEIRGCSGCHGQDMGGAKIFENAAMGKMYGPNLTSGTGWLPKGFSVADWTRAIRHGVAPDGHALVLMPSQDYASLTDDDLADLIAFLRSMPAVNRASVPASLGPVARALLATGKIRLAADVIDQSASHSKSIAAGPTAEYGLYLAVTCVGCHGANFAGGKIRGGPPDWPKAQNLTPAGDLARWSEEDFVKAIRTARRPDGSELNPVMPRSFGQLNSDELRAIWLYLKTLPPAPSGGG